MTRIAQFLLIAILTLGYVHSSYAGNGDLKVGGTLEMTSSTNGFLPPRMSKSARDNLVPSQGMLIYNTDDNVYNYYTSSGWAAIGTNVSVHDNAGSSSDYNLAVGETAKIAYDSTTLVPLHIATSEGVYEVQILGDRSVPVLNNNVTVFMPNNTSGLPFWGTYQWSGPSVGIIPFYTDCFFGEGRINNCLVRISTFKKSKTLGIVYDIEKTDNSPWFVNLRVAWKDTTTSWTSLGTIKFPYNQSGVVVIRRIL